MVFRIRRSGKQSEKKVGGQRILSVLDRYIPSEDSKLADVIRRIVILWRFGKVLLVVGGLFVIYRAAQIVGTAYMTIPSGLIKGLSKATAYFMPLFLNLLMTSLTYLWQPILLYILIAFLTKSKIWRRFWCLVGVAGFLIIFVSKIEESTWKEYHLLPLLLMQGYLFILWLLPRESWNVVGLVISTALGLIILILPDLPTAFDDFGMFGAILAFFLGYLNALASLLQRAVRWL
jgi:hypothetical protein